MKIQTIIAMGGGHSGELRGTLRRELSEGQEFYENSTKVIDEMIVKATGKDNPVILLITTASEDGKHNLYQYIKALTSQYENFGAEVLTLNLITDKPGAEEIQSKISSADAIYVTGGNSKLMIDTWREKGVDMLLRQAYEKGVVMSGLSAGSIAWFKYGNSNSYYTGKPFVVEALGFINAFVCPHYDSEPFRQKAFKVMLKKYSDLVGIALDEYAAIEIANDTYRIHSYGQGGGALKCYWNKGKYHTETIEVSNYFAPLTDITLVSEPDLELLSSIGPKRLLNIIS